MLENSITDDQNCTLTVNSAVGAISSAAHLGGLVAVYAGDQNLAQIQTLGLSVRLNIAQKIQEGLGRLLGPLNLVTGGLVLLGNGVSANATGVLGEGNSLLEGQNVLQVASGLSNRSALDGLSNLTAVLEVHTQVGASGLGGLGDVVGLSAISIKSK